MNVPLDNLPALLAPGIRSRLVDNGNGCTMHVLEAGHEQAGRPCVLLLHGFPELAFSWRHQLLALAEAGFHAVAPDQRGYGRSGGTRVAYDDDLFAWTLPNRVADAFGLLRALGHEQAAAVIGHDYGSIIAGWCALVRPDVFRSVAMMSAPFRGAPAFATAASPAFSFDTLDAELARLPRPRKHYWPYFAGRQADADLSHPPQGVHAFLRAYFHYKSADWEGNQPAPLASWAAPELAKLPTYYVMDAAATMPQSVAPFMPSQERVAACSWLPEAALAFYAGEFGRTGFQGALQGYRVLTDPRLVGELRVFAGRRIEVPACFISGAQDWGNHQAPGALAQMRIACPAMSEPRFIPRAGHWVQQEQPEAVNRALLEFLLPP